MRGLIVAFCAAVILSACSSNGGGTSNGTGSIGVNAGATGLIITATLDTSTFSADTTQNICNVSMPEGFVFAGFDEDGNVLGTDTGTLETSVVLGAEIELEDNLATVLGTLTISIVDTGPTTTPNKAINFTEYTVSFTSGTPGAIPLASRTHGMSLPVVLGTAKTASASASVALIELDTTRPTFASSNPVGNVFTYAVRVSARGVRLDTGEVFNVSAIVTMELGDFDRC